MPYNNPYKRSFPEEDATKRAGQRAKTPRTQFLVRNFNAEVGPQIRKDDANVCILPPDWGSQLYSWFIEHGQDIDDEVESEDILGPEASHPLPLNESTQLAKQNTWTRDSSRTKHLLSKPPLALNEGVHAQVYEESSAMVTEADSVFSPSDGKDTLGTSEVGSVSSSSSRRRVVSGSGSKRPTLVLRPPKHPPRLRLLQARIIDSEHAPPQKDDNRNLAQPSNAIPTKIGRPYDIPESWEETHPADKMMFCMRQENQGFKVIAQKWKEMTGHSDGYGHLEYRFRQLKHKLGLTTDEDIERVLVAEATARSKEELDVHPEAIETGFDSDGLPCHSRLIGDKDIRTTQSVFVTGAKRRLLRSDEMYILDAEEARYVGTLPTRVSDDGSELVEDNKWVRMKIPREDLLALREIERQASTASKQAPALFPGLLSKPRNEGASAPSRSTGINLKFKTVPLPWRAFKVIFPKISNSKSAPSNQSIQTKKESDQDCGHHA